MTDNARDLENKERARLWHAAEREKAIAEWEQFDREWSTRFIYEHPNSPLVGTILKELAR